MISSSTGFKTLDVEQDPSPLVNHTSSSTRSIVGWKWNLLLISIFSLWFLFALDSTIVAAVQPQILESLEINKPPWISVTYALCGLSTCLIWCKPFGLFDGKWLYTAGALVFEIGSAICGAAPTVNTFIGGQPLCRVGGMGVYLGVFSVVSRLTTPMERPVYHSLIGATFGIGHVLGPIIGGPFADSEATWRWAFYINLVIVANAAPGCFFALLSLNPQPDGDTSMRTRLRSLDFVGAVLSAGAICSSIMAIAFGGSLYAWNSGQIIALYAGILWIAFIIQQHFAKLTRKENRMFPEQLIHSVQQNLLFALMVASQVALFIAVFFIPIYFQFGRGDNALHAGVRLLPFLLPYALGSMIYGALMPKLGYVMPFFAVGGVLSLIGSCLIYPISIDASSSTRRIYGGSVVLGRGLGLISNAGVSVSQALISDPRHIHLSVSWMSFARLAGITLGLALSNSVYINETTRRRSRIVPSLPRGQVQDLVRDANSQLLGSLTAQESMGVLSGIVGGIKTIFILAVVACTFCVVLSSFVVREKIYKRPSVPEGCDQGIR